MQPLVEIIRDPPGDIAAAVLVTIHVGEQTRLPQILSRSGPLPAVHVGDREVLEQGGHAALGVMERRLAEAGCASVRPATRSTKKPLMIA